MDTTHANEGVKDIVRIILAVLLPPLGVALQVGLTFHFWLNLVLTLFFWVPGMIHAFYVILTRK
ncbi:MAG: YqaE/Pmp3 family membrane protein [Akkermansiaceae bacterium]|nr:YqaE/Pmp3 family membrane protein [Akkermansiaceae bacterium]NNM28581.1 YqaE/Pmp3 family membrane protein [Akkermansiaceae bacterium]